MRRGNDEGHVKAARKIIADAPAKDSDLRTAEEFLRMTDIARRTMLKKYERMADIFSVSGKHKGSGPGR